MKNQQPMSEFQLLAGLRPRRARVVEAADPAGVDAARATLARLKSRVIGQIEALADRKGPEYAKFQKALAEIVKMQSGLEQTIKLLGLKGTDERTGTS